MKNGKSNFGFSYVLTKYGKFWSVLLELFVKHKLWNWEEWQSSTFDDVTNASPVMSANYIIYPAGQPEIQTENAENFSQLCGHMTPFFKRKQLSFTQIMCLVPSFITHQYLKVGNGVYMPCCMCHLHELFLG